jgi:hypothetical protein
MLIFHLNLSSVRVPLCLPAAAAHNAARPDAQPNRTPRARTDALLILLLLAMSLNAGHLAPDIAAAARTSSSGLLVLLAIVYYDLSAQITRTRAAPLLLALCAHRVLSFPVCCSVLVRVVYALFAAVRALQTRRLKDAHTLAIYGQHNRQARHRQREEAEGIGRLSGVAGLLSLWLCVSVSVSLLLTEVTGLVEGVLADKANTLIWHTITFFMQNLTLFIVRTTRNTRAAAERELCRSQLTQPTACVACCRDPIACIKRSRLSYTLMMLQTQVPTPAIPHPRMKSHLSLRCCGRGGRSCSTAPRTSPS